MTSKCLKSKILRIALCFLLGGALNELNARDAGGVAAPRYGVNQKVSSDSPRPMKRKASKAFSQTLSQQNLDASLFANRNIAALSDQRNDASERQIEEQRQRRYAQEREDSKKAIAEIQRNALSNGALRFAAGGDNIHILTTKKDALDNSFNAYKNLKIDQDIAGVMRSSNVLDNVHSGNMTDLFNTGDKSKDKELAKKVSYATGAVFEHIAQTGNIEMCEAAVNSLRGRSQENLDEIKKTKVDTGNFPEFKEVAHMFDPSGLMSNVTADSLLDAHKKLMGELENIDPASSRGKLLQRHLDIIANIYTQTIFEKVKKLNEYDSAKATAGLDTMIHDNVVLDLTKFEDEVKTTQNHYQDMLEHHNAPTGSNDPYKYVFQNHKVEIDSLNNENLSNDAKNDSSILMLKTLAEHKETKFEEFHHFLVGYTGDGESSHVDNMHKQKILPLLDEKGNKVEFTAGEVAAYLKGARPETDPNNPKDSAKAQERYDLFAKLAKENKITETELKQKYFTSSIEYLDGKSGWHLTIPQEEVDSMFNSHELSEHELANKKSGNQNNKNTAAEDKK